MSGFVDIRGIPIGIFVGFNISCKRWELTTITGPSSTEENRINILSFRVNLLVLKVLNFSSVSINIGETSSLRIHSL